MFRRNQMFEMSFNNAGSGLANHGKLAEAIPLFRQAIAVAPDYPDAYFNLGFTYWNMGRKPDAHEPFARAVQLNPDDARSRYMLGLSYIERKDLTAAAEHLRRAVALAPQDLDSRGALSQALSQLGLWQEAMPHLKEVIRLRPEAYQVKLGVAWVLATSSDPQVRDGKAAVDYANELVKFSNRQPFPLDVLGAAYAACGEFDKAIAAVDEAITKQAAESNQPPSLLEEMRKRRTMYQQGQPVRSP
jgi:tetratricopeptide (TPR) repeat protein